MHWSSFAFKSLATESYIQWPILLHPQRCCISRIKIFLLYIIFSRPISVLQLKHVQYIILYTFDTLGIIYKLDWPGMSHSQVDIESSYVFIICENVNTILSNSRWFHVVTPVAEVTRSAACARWASSVVNNCTCHSHVKDTYPSQAWCWGKRNVVGPSVISRAIKTVSSHLTNLALTVCVNIDFVLLNTVLNDPNHVLIQLLRTSFFVVHLSTIWFFYIDLWVDRTWFLCLRYSMPTLFNPMQFVVIYLRFCVYVMME